MPKIVAELMRTEILVSGYQQTIASLLPKMAREQAEQIYVLDNEQRFYGIVPNFVLCKALLHQQDLSAVIGQFACCQMLTITPADSLATVAPLFRESRFAAIPVLEQTRVVGELRRGDMLTAMITQRLSADAGAAETETMAAESPVTGPRFWASGRKISGQTESVN